MAVQRHVSGFAAIVELFAQSHPYLGLDLVGTDRRIEALADGGKKMGLANDVALTLATQTVLGAAQLAGESKLSPDELRAMVVTPGGTTAAGLAAMEKLKTSEGLIAAVEVATRRGQEMAKENL